MSVQTNIEVGTKVLIEAEVRYVPEILPYVAVNMPSYGAFPKIVQVPLSAIRGIVTAEKADPAAENHNKLELAIQNGAEVEFGYNGEVRELAPESIFVSSRGDELVGGYDLERAEYRAFRLDRIEGEVEII